MQKKHRGFTLIELLVVVLIIGILASVAIPQYFKIVETARVSEAKSLFASVSSSQARYFANNGLYTGSWNELDLSFMDLDGQPCSGTEGCSQKNYTYMLDPGGAVYAVRNPAPTPPALYGEYTLVYDLATGETTCTQADCIMDLL